MRGWIPAVLAILALTSGACAGPGGELTQEQSQAIQDEVMVTLLDFVDALNAHDADLVLSYYTPSPELVRVGCTNASEGFEGVSGRIRTFHDLDKDLVFEMSVLDVLPLSTTSAEATMGGRTTATPGLFWSLAMVKQPDGRWLIAHEHQSWPGCSAPPAPHVGTDPDAQMPPDTMP